MSRSDDAGEPILLDFRPPPRHRRCLPSPLQMSVQSMEMDEESRPCVCVCAAAHAGSAVEWRDPSTWCSAATMAAAAGLTLAGEGRVGGVVGGD